MIEKILVVDDESIIREFIALTLRRKGFEVVIAQNGKEAIKILQTESFELVISDLKMPYQNGLDVLKETKKLTPQPLVILATAFSCVDTAAEAMKLGAFHFLIKPFSPEALEIHLENAEKHLREQAEHRFLREEQILTKCPLSIAESPAMKKIVQSLGKISKSQASVFITGESGTGKEVIAAAIHQLSSRVSGPFIKVNCAAIPDQLIESEFFGHERGAFTGAMARKIGRFELADKGTLLLDEVTEIPLSLQAKLLRAIQEMEFERVGGSKSIQVNTRILATSNRLMTEAIESKSFREDLYYRLNVIPIHLPPLRQRAEDILPLAEHFLHRFCVENHKPKKIFTQEAIQKLLTYHWPGNVRELANIIERTVVLDFDLEISCEHLYLDTQLPPKGNALPIGISLHTLEKRLILETLEIQGQNRGKTASILGISVRTLRNKLHEYGVTALED